MALSTTERNQMIERVVKEQLQSNPEFQKNLADSVKMTEEQKAAAAPAGGGTKELRIKVESTPAPPMTVRIESEPTKILVDSKPLTIEPLDVNIDISHEESVKSSQAETVIEAAKMMQNEVAISQTMCILDWVAVAAALGMTMGGFGIFQTSFFVIAIVLAFFERRRKARYLSQVREKVLKHIDKVDSKS